jgi:phosphoribosylamine--glycine ligase/phosphoribosylformylglycinamidine cyclo-ligase
MSIRILILGSGGREHALAWKLARSQSTEHVYVCPGNGGTFREPKTSNVDLPSDDFPQLVQFAVHNNVSVIPPPSYHYRSSGSQVNLVVPGPEQPLVDGVEAHFRRGLRTNHITSWQN